MGSGADHERGSVMNRKWIGLINCSVRHLSADELCLRSVCGYIKPEQHMSIVKDVDDRRACQACARHLAELLIHNLRKMGINA